MRQITFLFNYNKLIFNGFFILGRQGGQVRRELPKKTFFTSFFPKYFFQASKVAIFQKNPLKTISKISEQRGLSFFSMRQPQFF
jgi:hypothetical protein